MIIQTQNTRYTLEDVGDGAWMITGHATYCPTPYKVRLLAEPTVGKAMWFEYVGDMPDYVRRKHHRHPGVVTSAVVEVINGNG